MADANNALSLLKRVAHGVSTSSTSTVTLVTFDVSPWVGTFHTVIDIVGVALACPTVVTSYAMTGSIHGCYRIDDSLKLRGTPTSNLQGNAMGTISLDASGSLIRLRATPADATSLVWAGKLEITLYQRP